MVAIIGTKTVRKGHRYYRRTIVKKTVLEDPLGLTKRLEAYKGQLTLSVGTTVGQSEQFQILQDAEKWENRRLRGSVTWWIVVI